MKKCFFANFLLAIAFLFSSAQADDLLDLLGGEGKDREKTQSELVRQISGKIKHRNAEQNIFLEFLEKQNYEKALYQWSVAFEDSNFKSSSEGRALYANLLWKNGLKISAIEQLFHIKSVKKISQALVKDWQQLVPPTENVWRHANIEWRPEWTPIFGIAAEIQVRSRQFVSVDHIPEMQELLKKTAVNSPERALLEWQYVLALAVEDKVGEAARVLKHLMNSDQSQIQKDLMVITAARMLFQSGYLDAAIQYYQKVSKTSDYWLVAQEEMAWSYMRKGQPQNTMAVVKTLLSPPLKDLAGPETMFLDSLAKLKVCDYSGVMTALKEFGERFKVRTRNLQKLAEVGETEFSQRIIEKMSRGRIGLREIGPDVRHLPLYAARDQVLYRLIEQRRALQQEAKTADGIYARSLTGGTGKVGFDARFDAVKQQAGERFQVAESAIWNRLKDLAKQEISQIQQILQKMHIIEAEVIQQVSASERVKLASQKQHQKLKGTTGKGNLKFPFTGEVWFDELDHYQIDVKKACQAKASL